MSLEPEEQEFLDWLQTIADYSVPWSAVERKVKEIEGIPQDEDLEDPDMTISFNFEGGITVSLNDEGEPMYPVRDIRQALIDKPLD